MATVDVSEAEARVAAIFRAHETAPETAARVARALTQAQIDGQGGHAFSRVPTYAGQAASGRVDGFATPTLDWPRAAYGVVDATAVEFAGSNDRLFRVNDLVEKPNADDAPSNLAIIGRYVLTPDVFKALRETEPGRGGEIQLTDAIRHLIGMGPVYAYRFEGDRFDAGDKLGFLKATVEFALEREDLGDGLREYLATIDK